MQEMFLKDVEHHRGDDNYSRAIEALQRAGQEYPQILHMFSYKMPATVHLERFTQEIMREAAPLFARHTRIDCGLYFKPQSVPVLNEGSRCGRSGTVK